MVTRFRKNKQTLMKTKINILTAGVLLAAATLRADVITDWNDIALPLLRAAPKISANRQFAIMHVAQFEAVNAVVGKYTPRGERGRAQRVTGSRRCPGGARHSPSLLSYQSDCA